MHVALRIAYDGTDFKGLARQPEGNTIEDALIGALRTEGLVEGSLRSGSRTDAGVSALANVVKVELDRPHLKGLVPAVQSRLPEGIWITGAAPIDEEWNVQHARSRTYQYWAPRGDEDLPAMQAAGAAFVGEHDFSAFARLEDRKAKRPVTGMSVAGDGMFWRFEVTAPGFLWNQVRRMVSACLVVGLGTSTVADVAASLGSGVPHGSFSLAPAGGLVLARVDYEPELAWASEAGNVPENRRVLARQRVEVARRILDGLPSGSS